MLRENSRFRNVAREGIRVGMRFEMVWLPGAGCFGLSGFSV